MSQALMIFVVSLLHEVHECIWKKSNWQMQFMCIVCCVISWTEPIPTVHTGRKSDFRDKVCSNARDCLQIGCINWRNWNFDFDYIGMQIFRGTSDLISPKPHTTTTKQERNRKDSLNRNSIDLTNNEENCISYCFSSCYVPEKPKYIVCALR